MKLITPAYAKENRKLHKKWAYGSSGHHWLGHIVEMAWTIGATSILDYGAGKGTLRPYLEPFGLDYIPYDPATFPEAPDKPADMVVCLDVLEHIEPECLNAVLDHMTRLTGKLLFAVVATRPSSQVLSDGRNAHLLNQDYAWWKPKLHRPGRWRGLRTKQEEGYFTFMGYPRDRECLTPLQIDTLSGKLYGKT